MIVVILMILATTMINLIRSTKFSASCLTRRDGIAGSSNLSGALGADLRDMYYLHWKQS